ncbi:DUF2817 domain-containing protein [Thalassotalea euphylliae]|uniref:DUF2817 domain-containing protein n=1 Tax=Thalassotalea euphylliae TaxID=1655234 RepID=A0A3E0TNX9_9GAMM|nr:M14 family zinc carboxypeptidase [Thalassotalea euphylliae]REL26276.1 DUF2817 domain-containing protein [Thalassotalea euphylliae]
MAESSTQAPEQLKAQAGSQENPLWHQADWASSALGQSISLYASHPPEHLNGLASVLFIGGVHGDEPEGVVLANEWLGWLRAANTAQAWLLIPCLNPDGYQRNERTNGRGVDLNRNYPSKCWRPEYQDKRYFPGSAPASEPEISALVNLIAQTEPRLIIHFHSWQPSVVYSGESAKEAASFLANASNYPLQPDIGYPTPGSLGEYGANDLGIGVICIEEQEGIASETIFPRFKQGLIALMTAEAG